MKLKPDLILLDVMMPEMDGIEIFEQNRQTPAISKTLVALLSARAEMYSQITGFEAGVFVSDRTIDVYIRKLREKIGPERIKTIKSVGYCFEA